MKIIPAQIITACVPANWGKLCLKYGQGCTAMTTTVGVIPNGCMLDNFTGQVLTDDEMKKIRVDLIEQGLKSSVPMHIDIDRAIEAAVIKRLIG